MDGWSMFFGAVFLFIAAGVISLAYCIGADKVYQECRDTGAYYVSSKLIMKCEAVK